METTDKDFQPALNREDGVRFHTATQHGAQCKTQELSISEIFHLMCG